MLDSVIVKLQNEMEKQLAPTNASKLFDTFHVNILVGISLICVDTYNLAMINAKDTKVVNTLVYVPTYTIINCCNISIKFMHHNYYN